MRMAGRGDFVGNQFHSPHVGNSADLSQPHRKWRLRPQWTPSAGVIFFAAPCFIGVGLRCVEKPTLAKPKNPPRVREPLSGYGVHCTTKTRARCDRSPYAKP